MDHPIRTLLYELFIEPGARRLERMWGFVHRSYDRNPKTDTPALLTEPNRSSSTPISSSSPQALTYCAFPQQSAETLWA